MTMDVEPTQADLELARYWSKHFSDELADEIARVRQEGRIEGATAMREAALRALKTAQYDPAPYTKGKRAIEALDPTTMDRRDR